MSKRPLVVISVGGGVAEIAYQEENVDVVIIDTDNEELYLYKNYICIVSSINEDGTVDLECVDTTDGSINNKLFHGVPAGEIEFYGTDSEGEYIMDEEIW